MKKMKRSSSDGGGGMEKGDEDVSSEEGSFEIEKIIDVEIVDNTLKYKVRWEGYRSDNDTWEPEENLNSDGAKKVLEKYKKRCKGRIRKLEQGLKGSAAKTRSRMTGWAYVEEDEDEVADADRELKPDDSFYEQNVGELKGETKHLVDFSKRVSYNERLLAELGSRERITRRSLQKIKDDAALTKKTTTSSVLPKPRVRRLTMTKSEYLRSHRNKKPATPPHRSASPLDGNSNIVDSGSESPSLTDTAVKVPQIVAKPDDSTAADSPIVQPEPEAEEDEVPKEKKMKDTPAIEVPAPTHEPSETTEPEEEADEAMVVDSSSVAQAKPEAEEDDASKAKKKGKASIEFPAPTDLSRIKIMKNVDLDALLEEEESDSSGLDDEESKDFLGLITRGDADNFLNLETDLGAEAFALECARTFPETGENCLHRICAMRCDVSHGHCDILGLVTRSVGDNVLNQKDNSGKTPLHVAITSGSPCLVRGLLRHNVSLNVVDKFGRNPLDEAYRSQNPEVFKAVLKAGATYCKMESGENSLVAENEELLREHSQAVSALLKKTREETFPDLHEYSVASPVFTCPLSQGPVFEFPVNHVGVGKNARVVLVLFVCSFNGAPYNWTARCWPGLRLEWPSLLNGDTLWPFSGEEYPMVFNCPLKTGHNNIRIVLTDTESNGLIFAAQAVIVTPKRASSAITASPSGFAPI